MMQLLAIAVGGAVGAVMRWLVASSIQKFAAGSAFPWGTLGVNAIGSLLLGFLFVWFVERSTAGELVRLAVTVGFLGAFTTFSTYSLESVRLLQEGAFQLALGNIVGQIVICLGLTWLGIQLARAL